jgi:hypothetical protein
VEWKADLREVDGIRKWYGKQPRLMRVACAKMLTEFAFGTRTRAITQIDKLMTVRNRKFVMGRLQVTKARGYVPVNQQVAIVGSTPGGRELVGPTQHGGKLRARTRFSGWVEQEFGDRGQRNRASSLAGRGGSESGQMRHAIRLKPRNEVVTIKDYNPTGGNGNLGGFIAMLNRKKEKSIVRIGGTFYKRKGSGGKVIKGYSSSSGGTLRTKSLEIVQRMNPKRTRRRRWLFPARVQYFQHTDLTALWKRIVTPLIPKPEKS